MTLWSYQAHMTTTSIKWNQYLAEPLSNYSRDVRAQHRIRGCIVCCRRCGGLTQPSLSTHTARITSAAGSVQKKQRASRSLKKKKKKLWGNALANNVALKESTVTHCFFSAHCWGRFSSSPPFKIHAAKTHNGPFFTESGLHRSQSHTVVCLVFGSRVAFYHQSVGCLLQVAGLTDSKINLPIKDHRCAGSLRASIWQKSKVDMDEKRT